MATSRNKGGRRDETRAPIRLRACVDTPARPPARRCLPLRTPPQNTRYYLKHAKWRAAAHGRSAPTAVRDARPQRASADAQAEHDQCGGGGSFAGGDAKACPPPLPRPAAAHTQCKRAPRSIQTRAQRQGPTSCKHSPRADTRARATRRCSARSHGLCGRGDAEASAKPQRCGRRGGYQRRRDRHPQHL